MILASSYYKSVQSYRHFTSIKLSYLPLSDPSPFLFHTSVISLFLSLFFSLSFSLFFSLSFSAHLLTITKHSFSKIQHVQFNSIKQFLSVNLFPYTELQRSLTEIKFEISRTEFETGCSVLFERALAPVSRLLGELGGCALSRCCIGLALGLFPLVRRNTSLLNFLWGQNKIKCNITKQNKTSNNNPGKIRIKILLISLPVSPLEFAFALTLALTLTLALDMSKGDIDEIVLVGGTTRIPLVKQQLK